MPALQRAQLKAGKGSPGRGGDKGGHYWHIYVGDTRAGYVFINLIDEPPIGQHASIQIYLNQQWRNQGIGREAYRLASHASDYNTIYAHMRKSNLGSWKAAQHAGYVNDDLHTSRQLVMVWIRP